MKEKLQGGAQCISGMGRGGGCAKTSKLQNFQPSKPATCNQQPVTSNQQPVTSNIPPFQSSFNLIQSTSISINLSPLITHRSSLHPSVSHPFILYFLNSPINNFAKHLFGTLFALNTLIFYIL